MKRVMWAAGLSLLGACAALIAVARPADEPKAAGDQDFVMKASAAGLAEVNFGRLAANQASSPDVKQFGRQMADDHGKANDELIRLANAKQLKVAPRQDDKHEEAFKKLIGLKGADFDREYLASQVADHKEAVALFEAESKDGKDEDVKAFAAKTLPAIQKHLEMAEKLAGGVKPPADKDKPAADKDKPAPDKDKPVPDKDKPAADKDKPATDKAPDKDKPAADKDKPAVDKDKGKDKPATDKAPDKDKPAADKDKDKSDK
jgi:putative membrane protein